MTNLTFLRHGEANKFSGNHRIHSLSHKGVSQALKARERLGNPKFDLVCHSRLLRAEQTALIIGCIGDDSEATVMLRGLFYDELNMRGVRMDSFFEKLGHAPLSDYLKAGAGEILRSFAREVDVQLRAEISRRSAQNVLVVGHGVLLPSLLAHITGEDEFFSDVILGECEGCRICATDVTLSEIISIEMV